MISRSDIIEYMSKAVIFGTALVFVANLAGYGISVVIEPKSAEVSFIEPLRIILLILSVIDIAAGWLVKRRMLAPILAPNSELSPDEIGKIMIRITIVLAGLCSVVPVYGLIYVALGGSVEQMIGYIVISLAGFMILRLRMRDFRSLPGMDD